MTSRFQRAAMSLAVDAARETAHDDDAGGRKLASDVRNLPAAWRARSGADDRNGGPAKEFRVAVAA